MTDDEVLDRYVRAAALFGEVLQQVGDDQWAQPTPCEEWDVRAVSAHVVVGDSQVPAIVNGGGADLVAYTNPSILGPNPLATWRGTVLAAFEALRAVGDLSIERPHPLGMMPLAQVVSYRITDALVHAWDIGQAIGVESELPDELAEHCLDFWFPVATQLERSGYFAAPSEPASDATPGERLLALLGRR